MSSRRTAAEAASPARGSRTRSKSRGRAPSPPPPSPPRSRSTSRSRAGTSTKGSKKTSKKQAEEEEEEEIEEKKTSKTSKSASKKKATPAPAPKSRSRSRGRQSRSRGRQGEEEEDEEEEQQEKKTETKSKSTRKTKRAEAEEESETEVDPIPVRRPVRTRSRSRGRDATAQPVEEASEKTAVESRKEVRTASEANMAQFGGPMGCFFIMVFSHFLVYYFFLCLQVNKGSLILPATYDTQGVVAWGKHLLDLLCKYARPTWYATAIYWIFWISQGIMAVTLPGVTITGFPIPSEGGRRLRYLCNAVASWWLSLAGLGALHYYKIFRVTEIVDNMGPLVTVSIISANLVALAVYFGAFVLDVASKDRSGNPFYDFFLGVWLNPRIGSLDLKMFAEVRVSWIMLFFITLSAAVKQYEQYGYVSASMWFMLVAHFLYTNAIMKGEDCIPTTWDIFHEKWGWMLVFWNMSGVPFVYTAQSVFILKNAPSYTEHSTLYNVLLFATLFVAYYIWDTTNSQKNRFRMQLNGSYVPRPWAFPQLPWGTLENPKALPTKVGAPLLIDGWYQYARKVHYTVDIIMSLTWSLSCGTCQVIPWFYVCFFTSFLIHRVHRDEERCAIKYGDDWKRYVEIVPYRFIPGVY